MTTDAQCPSWFDDAARAEWDRVRADGGVENAESATLIAYCCVHSLWTRAVAALEAVGDTKGPTWEDAEGITREHPLLTIEGELGAMLLELARTLGIDIDRPRPRRSTRILFLDEGPPECP